MKRISKLGFAAVLSLFLAFIIFDFSEERVMASGVVLPSEYYFMINGQKKPAGTEYEMTAPQVLINVTSGGWEPSTTVEWVSSEPGVVSLEASSFGSNFINLVRKGPGYSTITAIIRQGTNSYSISFLVKVALSFDVQKTGLVTATTTKERILILDAPGQTKQVFLKYVDYTPEGDVVAVSGSAISASAVNWESENEGVATINSNGVVTAVGSGSTTITVTSNTMSSTDRPMAITMKVVVSPQFSLTFADPSGTEHTYHSYDNENNPLAIASGVPSNFVIESNASLGTNLKWEIYDFSTGKKLPAGSSSKMTYSVSEMSGNVSFTGVKAGTYEIYAFADKDYNKNTNAPYAYLKIVVPIDVGDINIVMTVGDTYSILDNSNIPSAGIFDYSLSINNIITINKKTSIIEAKKKGKVTLTLSYISDYDLYDGSAIIDDIHIYVTVIDGISLSTTSAILNTKGTLQLDAIVTDHTSPIIWSTSDASTATVTDGGLVTGVKAGYVTITASQNINGIIKKATCEITVQQSVSNIVVSPATITLAIGGYTTMHATVTPNNLSGVSLQWKSSDERIVKVVEASALTATVQGVAGGHAVISAINQDNVVVGYCHVSVQQPVTSITLSETQATVALSARRLQLRAVVYPENALNKTVTWKSTDTTKATVDENGQVTLLKPGTVSIIATSADNPRATAICNLNILVPVVSVALDERAKTMYVGQTARLTYSLLPADASNNVVSWTSTNTSVATVDSTGLVSAKGVGTSVIILKTADGGYSVYCNLTVKRVATSVKFDVSELKLKVGEYYYIKTTLSPKDSTDNDLVWESSDTKVATVDANGKVTAKAAGSAIIMARTEAGGIAYCKVGVTLPVQGLLLSFSEKTIYVGQKFTIKASVTPSSASQLGVTWKSSNVKVATVSENGEVSGLIGGVAIITCSTMDGGFSATCVVTVRETVTTIKLDYENYNLGIDKTFILTATVSNETATNQNVAWSSSDDSIATVNQKGKVTGIKAGYATITATALDGSDVEASCEVRVVTPVDSITISSNYMTLYVGDNKSLTATIKPNNSTFRTAVWSSSDPSVALVDDGGRVTALKAGTATITARTQDNSGKTAICAVAVYDRVPSTGITLQDKKITMVSTEEKVVQLVLIPATSTDSYTWSTDNPAVARVDTKSGKITARSPGTAYVTVMTDSGKTATVEVTVIGLNITELVTEEYTTYTNILEVQGATSAVKYTIDNPLIAVVYSNGTVSTRGVGTATITATVNGRKLTCKLIVNKMK
jgi:uncharacterized protein YjdB